MPSITALPTELLDIIFRMVHTDDVASARSTNRYLSDKATPYVIPEFSVYYTKESLSDAANTSTTHPQFARDITSLWFQADGLEKYDDFDEWDQERHFRSLNLETLPIEIAQLSDIPPEIEQVRVPIDVDILPFVEAISIPWYLEPKNSANVHAFHQLLMAAIESNARIEDISITQVSPPLVMSDELARSCEILMSGVKTLNLHVHCLVEDDDNVTDHLTTKHLLPRLLKSAMRLCSLSLEVPYSGRVSFGMSMCLTDLFGATTFRYLKRMKLAGVQVKADELVAFVDRHRDSLRELTLILLIFHTVSEWKSFLTRVAAELSSLEVVEFSGLHRYDGGPFTRFHLVYNKDREVNVSFEQRAFKAREEWP
ncbi:hypothetical protein Slin15195_G082470 [Septoria linicola]|uniref:F-box domain-containing protein n=1 Tax=Septoria linicola TaxID=215465 RepID=A0A9Q9AZL7_9PEZI|nr:hypothetical protein Slin15195_G082470 [Septoria linicola]